MVEIFLVICVLWIIVTLVDIDFSQKRTSYKTRRLEFWQELHKKCGGESKIRQFRNGMNKDFSTMQDEYMTGI